MGWQTLCLLKDFSKIFYMKFYFWPYFDYILPTCYTIMLECFIADSRLLLHKKPFKQKKKEKNLLCTLKLLKSLFLIFIPAQTKLIKSLFHFQANNILLFVMITQTATLRAYFTFLHYFKLPSNALVWRNLLELNTISNAP